MLLILFLVFIIVAKLAFNFAQLAGRGIVVVQVNL